MKYIVCELNNIMNLTSKKNTISNNNLVNDNENVSYPSSKFTDIAEQSYKEYL